MTDVRIAQTPDGGEIALDNGIIVMGDDVASALYLSMFGGNTDDPGAGDTTKTWWGNIDETDPARQYRSKTQHLLQSIPSTSANLKRIQEAVASDIAWASEDGTLKDVQIFVGIPGLNRVKIRIDSNVGASEFVELWEGVEA